MQCGLFVPLQMHGDARLLFQKDQHYRSKVWTYPPMSIMYIDDKQYNFFFLYNSVILCPVIELLVTLYSIHIFYFVPVPGIKQLKTVSFLLRLSNAASWSYPRYKGWNGRKHWSFIWPLPACFTAYLHPLVFQVWKCWQVAFSCLVDRMYGLPWKASCPHDDAAHVIE